MKFNIKAHIKEAGEGFLGDISDAESLPLNTGNGITDPSKSGSFGSKHQNTSNFKPSKNISSQELDQIHSLIYTYLSGPQDEPRQALYGLKVRLNHVGLDFEFNRNMPLPVGPVSFKLTRYGEKFGTTPTTNLMKDGFDKGTDYTNINLTMTLNQDQSKRYNFSNINLTPENTASVAIMIPVNSKMTAESVYNFMASDEDFCQNIFKPILTNLYEKVDNNTLTDLDLRNKTSFMIERVAKKLNLELSENDMNILIDGLVKQIFSEEVAVTSQKEKRQESMKRLRKEVKLIKGKR